MTDKQTVIVVHGTWCNFDSAKRGWYEPPEGGWHDPYPSREPSDVPFTARLNEALAARGSPARCWAHCSEQGDHIFQWWPGENNWISRLNAAAALADYVAKLNHRGWLCHIVAHSHGGNVVLGALPRILSSNPGKIVTLGTPFIDTDSEMARWRAGQEARRLLVAGIALAVLIVGGFVISLAAWQGGAEFKDIVSYVFWFALLLLFIGVKRWRARKEDNVHSAAWHERARMLVLNSPMDEAWQVLHQLRTFKDPIALKSNLARHLSSALNAQQLLDAEVARLQGSDSADTIGCLGQLFIFYFYLAMFVAIGSVVLGIIAYLRGTSFDGLMPWSKSIPVTLFFFYVIALGGVFGERFYAALWSPYRRFKRFMRPLSVLPSATVTYFVRQRSWSILQSFGMGLDGFVYRLPKVEQRPSSLPEGFFEYESLSEDIERLALERRNAWLLRHLGTVSQTLSYLTVTSADITLLLRSIEADLSLVHATYYPDENCIERIADWIVAKPNR